MGLAIDERDRIITPYPVLIYMENHCRDHKCTPKRDATRPSSTWRKTVLEHMQGEFPAYARDIYKTLDRSWNRGTFIGKSNRRSVDLDPGPYGSRVQDSKGGFQLSPAHGLTRAASGCFAAKTCAAYSGSDTRPETRSGSRPAWPGATAPPASRAVCSLSRHCTWVFIAK